MYVVGCYPSGWRNGGPIVGTCLAKFLLPELFDNVRDANPKHTDRHGIAVAGLVVHGNLDLVGIVNGKFKVLLPSIGATGMGASARGVFDFDNDGRFSGVAATESLVWRMFEIASRFDRNLKGA